MLNIQQDLEQAPRRTHTHIYKAYIQDLAQVYKELLLWIRGNGNIYTLFFVYLGPNLLNESMDRVCIEGEKKRKGKNEVKNDIKRNKEAGRGGGEGGRQQNKYFSFVFGRRTFPSLEWSPSNSLRAVMSSGEGACCRSDLTISMSSTLSSIVITACTICTSTGDHARRNSILHK